MGVRPFLRLQRRARTGRLSGELLPQCYTKRSANLPLLLSLALSRRSSVSRCRMTTFCNCATACGRLHQASFVTT